MEPYAFLSIFVFTPITCVLCVCLCVSDRRNWCRIISPRIDFPFLIWLNLFLLLCSLCAKHTIMNYLIVRIVVIFDRSICRCPSSEWLKNAMPYFPAYFVWLSECVYVFSVYTSHKRAGAQLIFINMYFRLHMCAVCCASNAKSVFYLFIYLVVLNCVVRHCSHFRHSYIVRLYFIRPKGGTQCHN